MFELSKEPPDRLLILGDTKLEELSTLLEDLNLGQAAAHPADDFEAELLSAKVL